MKRLVFWTSAALLAWAQAGYGLALAALRPRVRQAFASPDAADADAALPTVSLIVAAHAERDVIAAKVANALALDYPREKLEVVVACDGSPDGTPELARAAGADVVLDLPRGGKVRAQDTAVRRATAAIVAFSDANALWEPDALRALVAPFATDPRIGYVCGEVSFVNPDGGTNQEGVYWRYEMFLRARESDLASVTAGNGAIYATRRDAYVEVDPVMGHDLKFPFTLVRHGWRCVFQPTARATERMVPDVEGEAARKRRMMSHAWAIVLRGGLLDPRGWPTTYTMMIVSHRWLRYFGPFLHLVALATAPRWLRRAQLVGLAAALAPIGAGGRARLLAKYYILTQGSIALGLADHLRHGTEAGWDPPEGTR
ncbi:MAG TPA: glycosyltransferase [Baekduia sp.]|uniref:glycosyltransferase n=1 Tax=Baekduia sp. TaxID=2600305 RepID=UPI002D787EEB|nr:glycosyltransferase [Baekduia sp.]HET6508933.1 glycosyltransferase [Baekduia sp.]